MSHLVEPGVKYFLHESLKQCHELKKEYYNLYYNIGGFLFLVGLITIILWVKYKGKLSPIEKKLKSDRDREYILEKIKSIPNPKRESSMITDLPKWE
tara:strand:- start:2740 stop:3030 length:291 start_codon:yes stop_codon:yes gene_type:complete